MCLEGLPRLWISLTSHTTPATLWRCGFVYLLFHGDKGPQNYDAGSKIGQPALYEAQRVAFASRLLVAETWGSITTSKFTFQADLVIYLPFGPQFVFYQSKINYCHPAPSSTPEILRYVITKVLNLRPENTLRQR